MRFLLFWLGHPREGVFLGLHLLLLQGVLIGEDVVVAHLVLLLHLLLLLALGLKTKLKIVELVQGLKLLVADRDAIGEDAFTQRLKRLF